MNTVEVNRGMAVLFVLAAGCIAVLYFLSKNKYEEYIVPLDKKEYPFKGLYPIGLYLLDTVKYKYSTQYDQKLFIKLSEISGHKYAGYYLQIHWANKISLMLLALVFLSMVGMSVGPDPGFGVFAFILLGAIFYFTDRELDEKVWKRRMSIRIDFPDFLNKLTLLVNAGLTVSRAWEKIVSDNKKETPLFGELAIVLADIRAGKPEHVAYEDFAKRCRLKEITQFVSVIVQNLRKGGAEVVSVLRILSNECWEMRKSTAKRLGEEAATKMLLPMVIMLLAILLIAGTPAVLALRGI